MTFEPGEKCDHTFCVVTFERVNLINKPNILWAMIFHVKKGFKEFLSTINLDYWHLSFSKPDLAKPNRFHPCRENDS